MASPQSAFIDTTGWRCRTFARFSVVIRQEFLVRAGPGFTAVTVIGR